jgi:hypothetical protein
VVILAPPRRPAPNLASALVAIPALALRPRPAQDPTRPRPLTPTDPRRGAGCNRPVPPSTPFPG